MKTQEKTLLSHVRELLINRPSPLKLSEIAEKCGCSVSCLSHIISGKTAEPSVNLVEKLYEFLSGKQLHF
jgi:transcriptional regulator with XRE-family HTH domain